MIYILLATMCLGVSACAQRGQNYSSKKKAAISAFEDAQNALRYLNYNQAHEKLDEAISRDPQFVEAWLLKGSLFAEQKRPAEAAQNWRQALKINPRIHPSAWTDLARMELMSAQYEQALSSLLEYERIEKGNIPPIQQQTVKLLKARAQFGVEALAHPVPYEPFNLGKPVNTPFDEYHPSLTVDGRQLIFTSREPVGKPQSGQPVLKEDIYRALKSDKTWQPATNIGHPINTPYNNEGSSSISPDGRFLFYTACNTAKGQGSCDIYYSVKRGQKWDEPKPLPGVNTGAWDSHPVMSADGRTFYFTSNRKGGKGGMDIWMSERTGEDNWSVPVSLSFNTPGDEMTPFIHPDDQTLYFASDYLIGMGGHDMFMVRRDTNGKWSEPMNLGFPINTEKDEHGLIVDPRGQLAYFATDRAGGLGGLDILGFPLYEAVRPSEVFFLEGKVRDAQTGLPLEVRFELKDAESGNTVVQSSSDPSDGSFLVPLPGNRNFVLSAQRTGYLFYSDGFFFKGNTGSPQKVEAALEPLRPGARMVLQNIFFETGKYALKPESQAELNTLVQMLLNNPAIHIEIGGHTDNTGKPSDNKLLSENRANSVYEYLISNGVDKERLSYFGYGPDKPIADNQNEEGRSRNRRTEFKIVK